MLFLPIPLFISLYGLSVVVMSSSTNTASGVKRSIDEIYDSEIELVSELVAPFHIVPHVTVPKPGNIYAGHQATQWSPQLLESIRSGLKDLLNGRLDKRTLLSRKSSREESLLSQYFRTILVRSHIPFPVFNRFIDLLNSGRKTLNETEFCEFFQQPVEEASGPTVTQTYQYWYYEHMYPYHGHLIDVSSQFQIVTLNGKLMVRPALIVFARWTAREFQRILVGGLQDDISLPFPHFVPWFVPLGITDRPLPIVNAAGHVPLVVESENIPCITDLLRKIGIGDAGPLISAPEVIRQYCIDKTLSTGPVSLTSTIKVIQAKFCISPESFRFFGTDLGDNDAPTRAWFHHVARTYSGIPFGNIPFFQDDNGMVFPPAPTIKAIALAELMRVWQ